MSYPTTGHEVYVSLNLSNTMLTGIGKGTITREEVSADYLKRLFARYGVIVSAKPEQRRLLEIVNERYDLELQIPETLKLFQLTEEHRRELTKDISKRGEEAKVAIRNVRRDFMDELKKMKKNSEITEDDLRDGEEQLQKITDDYVKQAETAAKKKEQEVLSI